MPARPGSIMGRSHNGADAAPPILLGKRWKPCTDHNGRAWTGPNIGTVNHQDKEAYTTHMGGQQVNTEAVEGKRKPAYGYTLDRKFFHGGTLPSGVMARIGPNTVSQTGGHGAFYQTWQGHTL